MAGTMFISKIEPIQLIKDMNLTADMFEHATSDHKTPFAHVIERTIGEAVYKLGMRIVDPFTDPKHIKYMRKWYKRLRKRKIIINIVTFCIPFPKIRRPYRAHLIHTSFYLSTLKKIVDSDRKY